MVVAYVSLGPDRLPRLPPRLALVRPPDRRRRGADRPHPRPLPLQRAARLRRPPLHRPLPRRAARSRPGARAPAGRSSPCWSRPACCAPRPGSSPSPTSPTWRCPACEAGSVRRMSGLPRTGGYSSAGLLDRRLPGEGARLRSRGVWHLALAAPLPWALFDWITAGSPTYSFTGTRETVETLDRQTGPVDLVLYGPRRLGEVLQWPGMVGAARRRRPRPRLPAPPQRDRRRRRGPRPRRLRDPRLRRAGDHRPLHDARRRGAGDLRRARPARLAPARARPPLAAALAGLRRRSSR